MGGLEVEAAEAAEMIPWTFKISKFGKGDGAIYELSILSVDNAEIHLMWTHHEVVQLVEMLTHTLKAEVGEGMGRLDISRK